MMLNIQIKQDHISCVYHHATVLLKHRSMIPIYPHNIYMHILIILAFTFNILIHPISILFHYGRTILHTGIMICTDGQNKKICADQSTQMSRAMISKFFSQFTKVYQS